ncbi:MAG: malonyl-CoA decarboxylase [Alphaproteobacteria bacterium]|nr:malonyl-CoA decarboxylase [Alphaproteobacteria bacterium]
MNQTEEATASTLFDRTLAGLRGAVRGLIGGDILDPDPDLKKGDAERIRERLWACLEGTGGEVSARNRAADLGKAYLQLSQTGRRRYLTILATEFDRDPAAVEQAAAALAAAPPEDRAAAEDALRDALSAPRERLLRQFNTLADGVKFLVDLRYDLMRFAREDEALSGLEKDLKRLLASWFDVGFLELRRIDWNAPASLLEKLIDYEAVHAIQSWQDLKNRLDSDRRCYAFFHPSMPDEPLIFVEVALEAGLADSVHALLDEESPVGDPSRADTAVFYSISNAQRGLAGIAFGDFLIKRVVDDLRAELPNLKTFATLSPIPGFSRWLENNPDEAVETALAKPGWWEDPETAEAAKGPVLRAVARYLVHARRRGRAADPVAHFHLSNGARMERLNWLANVSEAGRAQSAGVMINYLYRSDMIEANHEAYKGEGRIAMSSAVRALAGKRENKTR